MAEGRDERNSSEEDPLEPEEKSEAELLELARELMLEHTEILRRLANR